MPLPADEDRQWSQRDIAPRLCGERGVRGDEVRIVLVFDDWPGMSGGAVWEDMKMGIERFTKWKRIALVTDVEWMRHATSLFGWMTPGDVKTFTLAQRDAAIAWAAG